MWEDFVCGVVHEVFGEYLLYVLVCVEDSPPPLSALLIVMFGLAARYRRASASMGGRLGKPAINPLGIS